MIQTITRLPIPAILVLGTATLVLASPPKRPPARIPDRFHLVYTVTAGGPGSAAGSPASRLEATFELGRGKLVLSLPEQAKVRRVVLDPWPTLAVKVLWEKVDEADLFRFKPQVGPMAPDFGMVELRAEARYGRLANTTDLNWSSPLRNDGQIWPLIDHLDRLMTGPTLHPCVSIQPHMSGIIPVAQPSPGPLASPDPVGEIEMLIALEATHLPIASDEMSMAISQASFLGPHFDKQRVKVAKAIAVLDGRISKESKDAELVSLRGAFHYDLGTYDRAAADFGKAVRLQPHQADHYNNRGMAFYRQGRKKEALADFGEALERNRSKYGHLERLIARMKH